VILGRPRNLAMFVTPWLGPMVVYTSSMPGPCVYIELLSGKKEDGEKISFMLIT